MRAGAATRLVALLALIDAMLTVNSYFPPILNVTLESLQT